MPRQAQGAPFFSYMDGEAVSQVPFGPADQSATGGDLNTIASSANQLMGTFTATTTQSLTEMGLEASYQSGRFTMPQGVRASLNQTFSVDETMSMTLEWDVADTNGEAGYLFYADDVLLEGGSLAGGSVSPSGMSVMQLAVGVTYRLVLGFEDVLSTGRNPAQMIMATDGTRFMRATVPTPGPMMLMAIGGLLLLPRVRPEVRR
ncbi:MAG: hypothetical protein ACYTF7_10815 [Planctomycetota bacterium]